MYYETNVYHMYCLGDFVVCIFWIIAVIVCKCCCYNDGDEGQGGAGQGLLPCLRRPTAIDSPVKLPVAKWITKKFFQQTWVPSLMHF